MKLTLDDIREAKKNEAAKKAVEALTNFVNCSYDSKSFCMLMTQEHRTLQQSVTRLMIDWLRQLIANKEARFIDGRNEAAANAAEIMIDALEKAGIHNLPYI